MLTIFELPEYRLGPYHMIARPVLPEPGTRRPVLNDWDRNQVLIDQTLPRHRQFALYVRNLIATMHFRAGLNYECDDEEAFTQNLASGLTELSQQRPFWLAFTELMQQELGARYWLKAARGELTPPGPKRIVCREQVCVFKPLSQAAIAADRYYALFDANPTPQRIELHPDMRGHNFNVVILHEVVHFIHEQWGLCSIRSGTRRTARLKPSQVTRRQAMALIDFLRHNPSFWTWWLSLSAAACEAL